MITQKEIFDYLKANPFMTEVWCGDLEDLNGKDYIFLDYLNDTLIGSDNKGSYKTQIQLTVATRDYSKRRKLVEYITRKFNVSVNYENSQQHHYYLARCTTTVIING